MVTTKKKVLDAQERVLDLSSLLIENTANCIFFLKFISPQLNRNNTILSVQVGVWFQILFLVWVF